jgi:serine/threonine protein kinase/uncharacterized protein (DUF2267 family)
MAPKNKAEEIFNQAVGLSDPARQAAYLEEACGGDEKLRAQVEALLQWHEEAGSFLEVPAVDPNATLETSAAGEGPGATIGRYKLLERIGEGGMATVYMAEQKHPIRRRVALKIIKLGMDTRQVIARFEAERQALAMMDHPHIAKVLDAGTTETGRPYFVMELVRGLPITEFCDKNNLTTRERLELFVGVCQAVHHAHQKGIIHRDIKPSNILVTLHDGAPVAKVIDFGIAKAVNQQLTEKTVFTRYAQMIGTPEYMSPEQAEMSGLDIDTRTDVFSLGVLLYELLTGSTPFDSEQLRRGGYAEIQRIIRETEPPKPSTKLSTLGQALTDVAVHRRTTADALPRLVRGDLDWIVMKALEKDRTRRYETAHALVEDVERHLRDEPVSAGRPSIWHRGRKFVRRHRTLVTGTSAVLVMLLVGIIGMTAFAWRAAQARDEATAVLTFFDEDLMGSVALQQAMSQQVTVRSILDAAAERLEGRFTDRPLAEASIRQTLGKTYIELGRRKQAEPHLKRAYDLRRRLLGEQDLLTVNSMSQLGRLYEMQARFKEAEPLLVQALESRRRILGADHADTLQTSVWLGRLYAKSCITRETENEAEQLLTTTLESARRLLGEEHPVTLEAMHGLAFLRGAIQVKQEEAVALCLEGRDIAKEALGEGHRLTCQFMGLASWLETFASQYEEAQRHAQAVLEVNRRVFGEEDPDTLEAMCTLGIAHAYGGNLEQAGSLLAPGIERMRSLLGEGYALVIFYSGELARVYTCQCRYDDAEKLLKRAIAEGGKFMGDDHRLVLRCMLHLMDLYAVQEQSATLEKFCSQEIGRLQKQSRDNALAQALIYNCLAWLQATYPSAAIRNGAAAIKNAKEACKLAGGDDAWCMDTLAAAYAESGDFAAAIAQEKKAIDALTHADDISPGLSENVLPHALSLYELSRVTRESYLTMLARGKIGARQYDAAERELTAAIGVAHHCFGATHPETLGCKLAFVELYEAWGKPDEAAKWRAQLPPRGSPPQW